jgi:hypothetical protein
MDKSFEAKLKNPIVENKICSNDLEKYFMSNDKRLIHKWWHYFEIYDKYFSKFRNKKPTILEIGISKGGSLQMWKSYFGEGAKIYGIDIEPSCKNYEEDGIEIFIGSQEDRNFLQNVKNKIGNIDILIDDGGHEMLQQIITFEELYNSVKVDGGIYLCEDTHSSYFNSWVEAGLKNPNSYIEMTKNLIDKLHSWHTHDIENDELTNSTYSIHYYDSVVVIEKRIMEMPWHGMTSN